MSLTIYPPTTLHRVHFGEHLLLYFYFSYYVAIFKITRNYYQWATIINFRINEALGNASLAGCFHGSYLICSTTLNEYKNAKKKSFVFKIRIEENLR